MAASNAPWVEKYRPQVLGEWTFYLTEPTETRTSCGHLRPDVRPRGSGGARCALRVAGCMRLQLDARPVGFAVPLLASTAPSTQLSVLRSASVKYLQGGVCLGLFCLGFVLGLFCLRSQGCYV